MVWAARKIKQSLGCPIISINAEADNDITPMSDLELSMPWLHDNSVCQTRTVTNFYAAALLLAARYAKDDGLWQSVHDAAAGNRSVPDKVPPGSGGTGRRGAGITPLCWPTAGVRHR